MNSSLSDCAEDEGSTGGVMVTDGMKYVDWITPRYEPLTGAGVVVGSVMKIGVGESNKRNLYLEIKSGRVMFTEVINPLQELLERIVYGEGKERIAD